MNRKERRKHAKQQTAGSRGASAMGGRQALAAATRLHRAGRIKEAEARYKRIVAADPRNAEARHLLGVLYAQTGRAEHGVRRIEEAVGLAPSNAQYVNNLGNAYMAAERLDEAAEAYRRAIGLKPDFADAHFNLGNALGHGGDAPGAVDAYGEALRLHPDNPQILVNLGVALMQAERFDEAADRLERATTIAPDYAEARFNLGLVRQAQGRLETAIVAYRAALDIDPTMARAHLNLGTAYGVLDEPAEAEAAFRQAIAHDSRLAAAYANLGGILHDRGHFEEAIGMLQKALALQPTNVKVMVNLGITQQETDAAAAAVETLRKALAIDPANKRAQAHLGIALQAAGRREEAAAVFAHDALIQVRTIDSVPGFDSIAAFNEALTAYIRAHATLMRDRPEKATQGGSQTLELFDGDAEIGQTTRRLIAGAVEDFVEVLHASANPHVRHVPERWRVRSWAVVLDSGGYQTPHIHPEAFCSGVYYVQVPAVVAADDESRSGWIKFGQSRFGLQGYGKQARYLTREIQPQAGRLVVFPSHFWHHTIPFESDEQRICVAFDVVAA